MMYYNPMVSFCFPLSSFFPLSLSTTLAKIFSIVLPLSTKNGFSTFIRNVIVQAIQILDIFFVMVDSNYYKLHDVVAMTMKRRSEESDEKKE